MSPHPLVHHRGQGEEFRSNPFRRGRVLHAATMVKLSIPTIRICLEAAKTASIEHTKPKEFQSHVSAIPTTVRPQALPFRCSVSLIPALCSRQAIISSNATSDFNYIGFDIPGSGVQTIDLLSALPTLTQPVTIDGTSQPGYGSQPLIQIDGSKAGSGVVGLDVASAASGSSFHGLSITDFSGGGMLVNGASNVSIVNDDIGLVQDSTGVVVHGNGVFGVEFENGASNNGLGNDVISGQAGNGVCSPAPGPRTTCLRTPRSAPIPLVAPVSTPERFTGQRMERCGHRERRVG